MSLSLLLSLLLSARGVQVTTLLKARGIDLDNNRFLILQGEVEQISMMKPKAQAPGELMPHAPSSLAPFLHASLTVLPRPSSIGLVLLDLT